MTNNELMRLAMDQLLKCSGYPKVGAVVSKDGHVLSTGFRGEAGGKHAERIAIEKLNSEQLRGATLHTTLEPCAEICAEQKVPPCCELISQAGIATVSIGALDPNGRIYAKGMNLLREKGLSVDLFTPGIREEVERSTFKYDDFSRATGSGRRRVRSVRNGKRFTVRFSTEDDRKVEFRLTAVSMPVDHVDLVAANDSVRLAPGVTRFKDIPDPLLFQDPSHYARLAAREIAIVCEPQSTMVLLVQLEEVTSTDLTIQWEVRNKLGR